MAERVLLLSLADLSAPSGGREMLGRINLILLHDLLGDRLVHIRPRHAKSPLREAWRGHINGIDTALIADLLTTIADRGITQMVIDGSNFGAAIAVVKSRAPHVRIITIFHNVEARFFWGAFQARRSAKSFAVLAANYLAERKAVRHSDVLVTLSARDSAGLRRLYGRAADTVAPMVLADTTSFVTATSSSRQAYALFVGGAFYANIAGIDWFARVVAPQIGLRVMVVGRGMDVLAQRFAGNDRVTLVGGVDDLAPWYADAALVIAPIFDGSGMKTKVAEALMHGKHVVGTPEAFSGYADDVVATNRCCADANAFVRAIDASLASPPPRYDPAMRALYERDHSPSAARARLARILRIPNQTSDA